MLKIAAVFTFFLFLSLSAFLQCQPDKMPVQSIVQPLVVTEPVQYDADDPAIWVNTANPSESLVLGTDKGEAGGLYVFSMKGKILPNKTVRSLTRPNNVDVAYGMLLQGKKVDIAVVTERADHKIRVFMLPDMKAVDNGGINVFGGETASGFNLPMGIALYTRPADNRIYAIVSRKAGPVDGTYLWQYLLEDNGQGAVKGTLVRKFGRYSGKKEIEAIAVDNELGYIYYSDESKGVRKYYADPDKGNEELALFGTTGFKDDHEGISIYKIRNGTGYIAVSDQGANRFHLFSREGAPGQPHHHSLLKIVEVAAKESDGSEIVNYPIHPAFPGGLLVAMSNDKTFHFYRWEDIAGKELKVVPPF